MNRHAVIVPMSLIFIWWMAVLLGVSNPLFLPSPAEVFKTLSVMIYKNQVTSDIILTLGRTVVGFLISSIVGIILGLLIGINRRVYSYFEFIIDFFKPGKVELRLSEKFQGPFFFSHKGEIILRLK